MDLFVALPHDSSSSESTIVLLQDLLRYCIDAGYKTVALTKTVYGRPAPETDRASSIRVPVNVGHTLDIRKRLHVVVENASDVASFCKNTSSSDDSAESQLSMQQKIFQEYDLVSVSPRNEAAWKALCNSAVSYVDIITLDAFDAGSNTSYPIRNTDVTAIMNRNMVLEIPYAAAVINQSKHARKQFIQTFRALQNASIGKKPHILVSSGNRMVRQPLQPSLLGDDAEDCGSLALRNPGDVINLLRTIVFAQQQRGPQAQKDAQNAVTEAAQVAIARGEERRFGKSRTTTTNNIIIHKVTLESSENASSKKARIETDSTLRSDKIEMIPETTAIIEKKHDDHADDADADDGFIAL
jgi:RNase P/RNase MRP subunit p30